MHERLRCAVIGTGGFGLAHLDSILHCPRASAVAIAEINPDRLKEAADRYQTVAEMRRDLFRLGRQAGHAVKDIGRLAQMIFQGISHKIYLWPLELPVIYFAIKSV